MRYHTQNKILLVLPLELLGLLLGLGWALLRLLERLSVGKLKGVRLELFGHEIVEFARLDAVEKDIIRIRQGKGRIAPDAESDSQKTVSLT